MVGATGAWVTEPKATGVPTAGIQDGYLLFGTAAGNTQWAANTFSAITGQLALDRLLHSGAAIGTVPTIVDLGGGVLAPRWRTPTATVADDSITPQKLDDGDAPKQLGFRTALGFPTGTAGQPLVLGADNTVLAGYDHFPGNDDTLALRTSSTTFQRITAVNPQRFQFRTTAGINFLELTSPGANQASITTPAGYSLGLVGQGVSVSTGTGALALIAASVSAGGNPLKPGQALGADGTGAIAGLSTYLPAPDVAHWTATVGAASGASGAGYDTASGNTFGTLAPNTFIWRGTTYTVHQVVQDAQHAIKLTVKPDPGAVDENWSFTVDGHTLRVSDATETTVARYGGLSREYAWAGLQDNLIPTSGNVPVYLNHRARTVPDGGTAGQRITIGADGVTLEWQTPAAGGTPGQPGTPLTVTPRQDHFTASRSTISSLAENSEYQLSMAANGAAAPWSAASNQIRLAAGQSNQMAWIDWHLDVDPTHWVSGSGSGGNRLFLETYFKRNGTIIEASRQGTYIRGDEDWAPSDHILHGSFTTEVNGGDNLTMFFLVTSGNKAGAEIRGVQVLNSDVAVSTLTYAGGSGGGMGGATTYQGLTNTPATVGTENQIPVWNAAGALVNRGLGDVLDTVSDAGRQIVWVKPSTGPGAQYSDTISRGVVLPSDYLSYDLVLWEIADSQPTYAAGTIRDWRIWPTSLLSSASQTNIDNSRVDWSAGNRTLSAGDTPDRFLRVVLIRGQGPTGPQGAAGSPGTGGLALGTTGTPAALGTAARGTSTAASAFDHVHPTPLTDDSITPAMAQADTASQKQAWQTRIGEDESSSYIFWRSSITPAGANGFSLLSSGTISDSTFNYEGTEYTVRKWESDGVGSFAINVVPDPGATAFNGLVAHFRGVTLKFADATSSTSTSFLPPGFTSTGREWTWANNHADILPTSGTVNIALGEDIGEAIERVEADITAVRQPPATPPNPTTRWLRGDNSWQPLPALVRAARESNAILTIAQATVSDRTPQTATIASLAGDHTAQAVTLASNALTFARPGLYHISYDLDVSIVSAFQIMLNRGNVNQRGSVSKLYPYPGQTSAYVSNQGTVAITAANQTVTAQWLGLDVPALANLVPPPPTAITLSAVSGQNGYYNVGWTYGGSQRVRIWHIEWRWQGQPHWQAGIVQVNREAARSAVINTQTTSTQGIDVRVWASNASGDGRYAQRTWAGVFSTQTAHSQTLAAVGDLVIRSEDWSR